MQKWNNSLLIITCNDLYNYGNRFQNVALTMFLEKLGFNVSTLWPNRFFENIFSKLKYNLRKIQNIYFYTLNPFSKKGKRIRGFIDFNRRFLHLDSSSLKINSFVKIIESNYQFILIGSDQVLNYSFGPNPEMISLVAFNRAVKLSYAISMGAQKELIDDQDLIKRNMKKFSFLSVREHTTKNEIQKYVSKERNIHVNIDPVFLIEKSVWERISCINISRKIMNLSKEDFIFVYWIGKQDSKEIEKIENFAKLQNLRIVTIRSNSNQNSLNTINGCSPYEFLYLLKKSKYSIVKSFHGLAMSIIFKKPFWIFDEYYQNNKNTHDPRFKNLLLRLEIPDTVFELRSHNDIDWEKVGKNIEREKNRTLKYFNEVISKGA